MVEFALQYAVYLLGWWTAAKCHYSNLYECLGILKPGMVDIVRILKSSQGPVLNLRKWYSHLGSVQSGDVIPSLEKLDQLQAIFLSP